MVHIYITFFPCKVFLSISVTHLHSLLMLACIFLRPCMHWLFGSSLWGSFCQSQLPKKQGCIKLPITCPSPSFFPTNLPFPFLSYSHLFPFPLPFPFLNPLSCLLFPFPFLSPLSCLPLPFFSTCFSSPKAWFYCPQGRQLYTPLLKRKILSPIEQCKREREMNNMLKG